MTLVGLLKICSNEDNGNIPTDLVVQGGQPIGTYATSSTGSLYMCHSRWEREQKAEQQVG